MVHFLLSQLNYIFFVHSAHVLPILLDHEAFDDFAHWLASEGNGFALFDFADYVALDFTCNNVIFLGDGA